MTLDGRSTRAKAQKADFCEQNVGKRDEKAVAQSEKAAIPRPRGSAFLSRRADGAFVLRRMTFRQALDFQGLRRAIDIQAELRQGRSG